MPATPADTGRAGAANLSAVSKLEELVGAAREGVERRKGQVSAQELRDRLGTRSGARPFNEALVRPGLSLIAEFKRRSPSSGEIRPGAGVAEVVAAFERGGAAALSVLTDESSFGGSLDDLRAARAASDLPILRKDFIVDPYQLYEAAVSGADAVLLIVAALEDEPLAALHEEARTLDLDCLVEVHDEADLDRALAVDADVIGINNRDLHELTVDVRTTAELITDVPAGKTVVSESGYESAAQLEELERIGVDAVLVGEVLMRADDPEVAVRELTMDEEATREHYLDRASGEG
jgi:indole-3-glycerol phosphate synthase